MQADKQNSDAGCVFAWSYVGVTGLQIWEVVACFIGFSPL